MIKLINRLTGTDMWVADERVDEYLEAGHSLASNPTAEPTKEVTEEKAAPKEKVTPKKKAAPKKKG